jgi:WD40 repeat protein
MLTYITDKTLSFVTVSNDHTARVCKVNVDKKTCETQYECIGHTASVESVAVDEHNPSIFCTGSWDNSIAVWNTNSNPIQEAESSEKKATSKKRKVEKGKILQLVGGHHYLTTLLIPLATFFQIVRPHRYSIRCFLGI